MENNIPFVKTNRGNFNRSKFNPNNTYRTNVRKYTDVRDQVPVHYQTLVKSLRMNADVRRLTGIGVIEVLKSNDIIPKDSKAYVKYLWNKFSVKFNGVAREYSYCESFFVTSYISACQALCNINVNLINGFTVATMNKTVDEITNSDEIKQVVGSIINHISENNEEEIDDNTEKEEE